MIAAILHLNLLHDVPLFIQVFVILMSIYHSSMFIMLKEIKKVSPSAVWNNLINANLSGIMLTLVTAALLLELHIASDIGHRVLFFAATFNVTTHYFTNLTVYYLITPIIREKINLFRAQYLGFYVFFAIILYFIANLIYDLEYPPSAYFITLFISFSFSMAIIIYLSYSLLFISKSYTEIGFVRKPFLIGGVGMLLYLVSIGLIVFYIIKFLNPEMQKELYYNIFLYSIFLAFSILYFFRFIIEYPSLLQPKWKALMPFDLSKVTAALTLAFLAVSFFSTVKENPNFIIYQNIPYIFVVAFLLPLLLGIILILTYLKIISSRTKLRYWEYLRYGLYIHLTVTFYVLSLIFLSWNNATSFTKTLCAIFLLASFSFYLFLTLNLRTLIKDLDIMPTFNKLDISHYLVSLYSWFFLLFFGISFTYGKTSEFKGIEFILFPVMLFLIVFFLIAYVAYLGVTHKGFEEIMKKGMWTELSYFAAYIAFLTVYLIYSSLGSYMQRFPYHNLFFLGYFAVVILEIAAIRTLQMKSRQKRGIKKDIVSLLNSEAHNFLRADYLEDMWEKSTSKYVAADTRTKIRFDPQKREFYLEPLDEKMRLAIAVEILLMMHKLPDADKTMVQSKSLEETREEIVKTLRENLLQLPEALLAEFDERMYYPLLLERAITDLLLHLKTFIPDAEHKMIFGGLKRRNELFGCINLEGEEIRVKEGTRFGREEFLTLFKLYLEAVGEKFPFKRCLLRGLVKEEIKKELHTTIAVGDVIDIVPIGLKEIDMILAGGLIKGSTTLLTTEETNAKQKILRSFIIKGLAEGTSVIYATTKRPSRQIVGDLLMDADSLKNFVIIDFYEGLYAENRYSELVEEDGRIIAPLNKVMLQLSIVKAIKSDPKDRPRIVILDVYDDFSKYYNPDEMYEVLQNQLEGLKRWNCTTVIVLDPNSYLMKIVGADEVKKNFENIIALSGGEKETLVIVEKLYHGTPFKPVIRVHW